MRIGLIGDIHGDIDGLKAALDGLQHHSLDALVCTGDLVDKGPNSEGVVALIRELEIPCVLGNHDQSAPRTQARFLKLGFDKIAGFEAMFLSDDAMAYLQNLPPVLRFEWAGRRALVMHGTRHDVNERIYPDSPQHVFERVFRECEADVIIHGHTHTPYIARLNGTLIANPGSICGKFSPGSQTFAVLDLADDSFHLYEVASGGRLRTTEIR